jgi:hypothetical protein
VSVETAHAGGHFQFGPTYNSTRYVRAAYEGDVNGIYEIDAAAAEAVGGELAGKIAGITEEGKIALAGADGASAVGLFREDLADMINASNNASFYFRGGEYHIAESRLGADIENFKIGKYATTDANGQLVPSTDKATAVATVISIGEFRLGNAQELAGTAANGGRFLGIILHI